MAIEVIIREDGTSTGVNSQGAAGVNATPRGKGEEQGKPKPNQINLNALLIDYGRNILSTGLNVALDYSGNNILADQISTVASVGADALMIAKGGWVGVAAVAMKYATSAITSSININREQYKAEMLQRQAGIVAEYGGRYTND